MLMLTEAFVRLINHVLRNEEWALARLRTFRGQTARIDLGGTRFVVRIGKQGLLEPGDAEQPPAVSVRLPDDALFRVLSGRAELFASATISGSVDLAESMAFVFRNLRWDAEDDLAQLFGDIVGRRLWQAATRAWHWQARAATNLGRSLADYWTEEEKLLASSREIAKFCLQVDTLRDDLARLEKRIARCEQKCRTVPALASDLR